MIEETFTYWLLKKGGMEIRTKSRLKLIFRLILGWRVTGKAEF